MDRVPSPKDLRGAASVARSLAYAVGLVGVIAGAVVYRSGSAVALAAGLWVITFAAGALLMIAGFLCDGLAALLARTAAIEQRLSTPPRPGEASDGESWHEHPNQW
ncbi:MAG: sulfite exporter TauE/SafE [Nitriliruptoraceae bacterium]|jgi:sulfite exporter TauE/SafE